MIFALYDEEDNVLGSYTREELKELLKSKSNASFRCIISRLLSGKHKKINYDGKSYTVYIYKGGDK